MPGGRRQAKPRLNTYYEGESANVSYLLENLLLGYDKRLRPNYKGKINLLDRTSSNLHGMWPVSYTHLTLPTILRV